MRAVIFSDLDDTLFQTRRKAGGEGLVPAASGPDGRDLSFMTPAQAFFVERLLAAGALVPVTARSRSSFARLKIPFSHGAILNFGGTVLAPGGETDGEWMSLVEPQAKKAGELLCGALERAREAASSNSFKARVKIIGDDGLPFYLVAKTDPGLEGAELPALKAELMRHYGKDASIHLNGNNLALVPGYLDKRSAAEYFLRAYYLSKGISRDELFVFGLGDGLSDRGFLGLCDYEAVPRGSQLAGLLL